LTNTALYGVCGGLTKRQLNNNRIINNTSCGGHDSAEADVMDGARDSGGHGSADPIRQAFAVTGVVSLGSTASPHDPHTSRASRRCPQ
jgi:hypothetical protein